MPRKASASGLLPRSVILEMAAKANDAIDDVLVVGSETMVLPPRTEVGFVAAVTLGGVTDIARAWKPLCKSHGVGLDLTGVFCHGAPVVSFNDRKGRSAGCELADLLIVVDVTNAGVLTRRAALIQAKMARAAKRVSLSGSSSRVQLDLYQYWHKFDFKDAAYGLNQVDFTIGPKELDSGTIGVIDRHLKTQPVWTQHAVRPTPEIISDEPYLGTFIAEMVDGTRPGFGRLATPALQTDWSKTVERLLQVTYQRAFLHAPPLGGASQPRGVRATACVNFAMRANLMKMMSGGSGKGPPFDFETKEDDDRPGGISVVHIGIGPVRES
jgi:hypothetical protein